jgi:hypothetical protein
MSTVELRKKLKQRVDKVPAGQLRSAMEYLDYLVAMRNRPPLEERLKQAEREFKAGLGTPWEKLRRKYRRV